jgi:hypothetical protein
MCDSHQDVDCRDALIEIALIVLFVVLATGASLLFVPRFV